MQHEPLDGPSGMVSTWGIAIKKDGEAECTDEMEIAPTEGAGMASKCARLVMVPKSLRAHGHYLHQHSPHEVGGIGKAM